MKRAIGLLLVLFICSLSICAQQNKNFKNFSPEKFRQAEEQFISRYANLSQAEANEFFPLFWEYKIKQNSYYGKMRGLYKKGWGKEMSDDEYLKIIEESAAIELCISRLKLQYIKKFQKVLKGKDIFLVFDADTKFHRNMLKGFMPQRH